jgi:putative transposase
MHSGVSGTHTRISRKPAAFLRASVLRTFRALSLVAVMIKTFRYRIKDGRKAVRGALRAQARSVNFVWNFCVQTDQSAADRRKAGMNAKRPSSFDLQYLCRGATKELGIHSDTVDAICANFSSAREMCFPKTPRFRSAKRNLDWIPFSNFARPARLDGDILTFLGRPYRLWLSREIPINGAAKSWNLACDSDGHWFVNIQVELPDAEKREGFAVGVDLGLKTMATMSDGTKIDSQRFFRASAEKLAMHQRRNQKRQERRLSAKIARQRKHFLHVESARLVEKFNFIAIGDVSSSRLMKTRMAKSVSDAGWAMFKQMIQYKAIAQGSKAIIVNERYSSQTCSCCGVIPDSSPKGREALGVRHWVCSSCGAPHDRDVNAAKNILHVGLKHQALAGEIPVLKGQGRC